MNFDDGQQCARDFFICLAQNKENWLDIYTIFNYSTTILTQCTLCKNETITNTREELYLEIDTPENNTRLNETIENYFTLGELVDYHCTSCKKNIIARKRITLVNIKEMKYLIVILQRVNMLTNGEPYINRNNIIPNYSIQKIRIIQNVFFNQ